MKSPWRSPQCKSFLFTFDDSSLSNPDESNSVVYESISQHPALISSGTTKPITLECTHIFNLPTDILLHLLHMLNIRDLLRLRSSCSKFRNLINSNSSVWFHVSFQETWPTTCNIIHFEKAAQENNIEALIKLSIAYLYNEGLPGDFEGKKILTNGEKAAEMFCRVETLSPLVPPFTWLFIRPPWSLNYACCKQCVFNKMKSYVEKNADTKPCVHVQICIAKTLQILYRDHDDSRDSLPDCDRFAEVYMYLEQASAQGSRLAAFLLWKERQLYLESEIYSELNAVRELREIANSGLCEAQLELCRLYGAGKYGGIPKSQAHLFIQRFVNRYSKPTRVHLINRQKEITDSMRSILIDWLVELANMKYFSSQTLHVAISVVDRFLLSQNIDRKSLQLLGISAMVLCSRFLDRDILTIREAAWLTDYTYNYESVVRMMGEITANLRGSFKIVTSLDLVKLFGIIASNDPITQSYAEYVCESSLLHSCLGYFPIGHVAASCILIARLSTRSDNPWTEALQHSTGFSVKDFSLCVKSVYQKCFREQTPQSLELLAVKLRYGDVAFHQVSQIVKVVSLECLISFMGISIEVVQKEITDVKGLNTKNLIVSPCRNRINPVNLRYESSDRDSAATPTNDSLVKDIKDFTSSNNVILPTDKDVWGDAEDLANMSLEELDNRFNKDDQSQTSYDRTNHLDTTKLTPLNTNDLSSLHARTANSASCENVRPVHFKTSGFRIVISEDRVKNCVKQSQDLTFTTCAASCESQSLPSVKHNDTPSHTNNQIPSSLEVSPMVNHESSLQADNPTNSAKRKSADSLQSETKIRQTMLNVDDFLA